MYIENSEIIYSLKNIHNLVIVQDPPGIGILSLTHNKLHDSISSSLRLQSSSIYQ